MAHLVVGRNLSEAWIEAMTHLLELPSGKTHHLDVAFPSSAEEDSVIRAALDGLIRKAGHGSQPHPVATVANTIFPLALYHPHLGLKARERLYSLHGTAMELQRRLPAQERESYFDRLVAYPGDGVNQLEFVIKRLAKQMTLAGPHSSAYETGLSAPGVDEMRIHAPGHDRNFYSFPCLSHISLTLQRPQLHLTATYRNQALVSRGYGNYLGLSRLLRFIAAEVGADVGEVQCVATHADAEIDRFGQARLQRLVNAVRAGATVPVS